MVWITHNKDQDQDFAEFPARFRVWSAKWSAERKSAESPSGTLNNAEWSAESPSGTLNNAEWNAE
jgi:hypothetical protein